MSKKKKITSENQLIRIFTNLSLPTTGGAEGEGDDTPRPSFFCVGLKISDFICGKLHVCSENIVKNKKGLICNKEVVLLSQPFCASL